MSSITPRLLSYYYDAEATRELPHDSSYNYSIDFGPEARANPPIAGQDTITTIAYVRNDHPNKAPMELRPSTMDPDLKIIEYPDILEHGQIGKVVFAFSPSSNRIKPLSGGSWDFHKVVYSL